MCPNPPNLARDSTLDRSIDTACLAGQFSAAGASTCSSTSACSSFSKALYHRPALALYLFSDLHFLTSPLPLNPFCLFVFQACNAGTYSAASAASCISTCPSLSPFFSGRLDRGRALTSWPGTMWARRLQRQHVQCGRCWQLSCLPWKQPVWRCGIDLHLQRWLLDERQRQLAGLHR